MITTKNKMNEAESLINGINTNKAEQNVKQVKSGREIVERKNKVILTEDGRRILLG